MQWGHPQPRSGVGDAQRDEEEAGNPAQARRRWSGGTPSRAAAWGTRSAMRWGYLPLAGERRAILPKPGDDGVGHPQPRSGVGDAQRDEEKPGNPA